jgi:predicted ATPase
VLAPYYALSELSAETKASWRRELKAVIGDDPALRPGSILRGAASSGQKRRDAWAPGEALCADGWAIGVSGESEKGLAQIGQGVDGHGLAASRHMLLALQADAQLAAGKPEDALVSAAAGLKAVEKMGGAPLEAELHRLRGEALLAGAGTVSEAETAMQQGMDVARRQNAKSWELRGATSLARLRQQQGRPREADPKEAKTLLDQLTEPAIAAEG